LDRRLYVPQSHSGHGGEEKNSQPPPGIEPYNPDHPACSPALYQLSYYVAWSLVRGRILMCKYLGMLLLGKPRQRWDANIKIVMG
jgi:hypothetical protein